MGVLLSESSKTVWLSGEIAADEYGSEFITVSGVREALTVLKNQKATIVLTSPGGDALVGLQLFNLVKRHPDVSMIASGVVASAATVVYLASKRRYVEPHAQAMVHSPWSVCAGSAAELKEMVDRLERAENEYVTIYTQVTGISEARIRKLMADETWLNVDEMIEMNFANGLFSDWETANAAESTTSASAKPKPTKQPAVAASATGSGYRPSPKVQRIMREIADRREAESKGRRPWVPRATWLQR